MTSLTRLLPSSLLATDQAEPLAARLRAGGKAEVEQAATQFESMFVSLLLKEMRQTQEGDGLFAGESSDTYGGMFDMYLGDYLAKCGPLGVRQFLMQSYLQVPESP